MFPRLKGRFDDEHINTLQLALDAISKWDGKQLIQRSYNLLNPEVMVPGTLNTSGEIVSSTNTSVTEFIPFKPGTYLNVKPTGKLTQFYDENYNYIDGVQASANFPVVSPSGTAYIRLAILNSRIEETYVYEGVDDKEYAPYGFVYDEGVYDADFIKEVKEQIEVAKKLAANSLDIKPNTQLFDKASATTGYYVGQISGELIASEGFYASQFISVIPGGKLMVTPTIGQSAFYNLNFERVGGFNASDTNPVDIPNDAYYLRTSGNLNSLDDKMVYLGTEVIPYQSYGEGASELTAPNQLNFNSDGFPVITTPYDSNSNIEYTFGQLGINEIYHLRRIKTAYFNQLVSSDHISPYRIKAVNNPVADNPVFVTGGNHGSDGSAGGFPTGKPLSIETYIDNKKITSGTHNTNSPIVVKVINEACAYNTVNRDTGNRRDVLRETITYTFYPNVHTVTIDMQALEPIEFYGHRGLSMQRHNHSYQAYVPTDSTGIVLADQARDFKSSAEGSSGNRIVHYNTENHLAVIYLDERFGLGDYALNTDNPRWFMSTGKTYSDTIKQDSFVAVSSGDSLILNGGYYFGRGLTVPGLGKGYTLIRSGKRVYCADDFYARSGYISVHPDDVGKEVKIIKNIGYTVDGFTTSKGLKFSKSSGAGTIMFEVI